MVTLICKIAIAFNAGGIPVVSDDNVKGKLVDSNSQYYLVDFSKSKQANDPDVLSDLSDPILVDKTKCVKDK